MNIESEINKMTNAKQDDKASKKIILTARTLFLEKGFSGVSIREIAKKANVPISLIYHYHENKIALWKTIKSELLENYFGSIDGDIPTKFESLEAFLRYVVTLRFKIYENDPDIARLITWQRLESMDESLCGLEKSSILINLEPYILNLQNEKNDSF